MNADDSKIACYCCGKTTARVMLYKKVAAPESHLDICDRCIEQLYHAYILALKSEISGLANLYAVPSTQ